MKTKRKRRYTREGYVLLLIAVPFILYIFAMSYVPLFGWLLSLYNFRPGLGFDLTVQEFTGIKNFLQIWNDRSEVGRAVTNSLALNGLGYLFSWAPMFFAIAMSEVRGRKYKRVVQTITTFPNFISWIVVFGIAEAFFSNNGFFIRLIMAMGFKRPSIPLLANVNVAWITQALIGLWKGVGWGAIIYLAAISGVDTSLYESAQIDGAGKLRRIWHITIPGIIETYFVLFLLGLAGLLSGFEQYFVFAYNNSATIKRLLTVELYVFRNAFMSNGYSYSIAVGIISSAISLSILFTANYISKKIRGKSVV